MGVLLAGLSRVTVAATIVCVVCGPALAQCDQATTQSALTKCFCDEYRKADEGLNATYRSLVEQHKNEKQVLAGLERAEQAWMAFRDAQMQLLFPNVGKNSQGAGSALPMCDCQARSELIRDRTNQLRKMMGKEEGDVCSWQYRRD